MGFVDKRPLTPTAPQSVGPAKAPAQTANDQAAVPALVPSHTPANDTLRRSVPQGQAMTSVSLETPAHPATHTVKRNESLSSIAKKYFGNPNHYMEIFNLNKDQLEHPNMIQKGMVLKLPQHLFPQPAAPASPPVDPKSAPVQPVPSHTKPAPPAKAEPALDTYRSQNPLSYVTLHPQSSTRLPLPFDELFNQRSGPMSRLFPAAPDGANPLFDITAGRDRVTGSTVAHEDAIKVNKRFDVTAGFTTHNLSTRFAPWAREVAGILREHQASIRLPNAKGEPVTLDADKLDQLANMHIGQAADYFRKDLGIALFNTLFAIDDVASDMKHDPYYADVKGTPKTVDLAAVAERFNLMDDKLSYLARTAAHRHKQVPIQLQGAATAAQTRAAQQTPAQMIEGLAKHFNARGTLTAPAEFEAEVYKLLENQSARRQLVQHFGLDSAENLNMMAPAITSEAGMGDNQRTYNSYFAVGSVMLNRALGRNLRKAAAHQAQGKPADKLVPVSMRDIVFEPGQFEITWRQMPGKGKTFFQYTQGLNQSFLKDKLGGDTRVAFETAYEAARDLVSGMHQLQAEVNGVSQKNSGRSTGSLFYFNQSRSQDYSQSSSAAVSLVDSNNTHVFFKEWDKRAYFRD